MIYMGGLNYNQALIAALSRVKAVSQLRVSHVGLRPDLLIGGGLPLLAPADFLERI